MNRYHIVLDIKTLDSTTLVDAVREIQTLPIRPNTSILDAHVVSIAWTEAQP